MALKSVFTKVETRIRLSSLPILDSQHWPSGVSPPNINFLRYGTGRGNYTEQDEFDQGPYWLWYCGALADVTGSVEAHCIVDYVRKKVSVWDGRLFYRGFSESE
jgi:hypothetical protein